MTADAEEPDGQAATLTQLREAMTRIESGEAGPSSLWDPEPSSSPAAPELSAAPSGGQPGEPAEESGAGPASSGVEDDSPYARARAVVLRKLTGSAKSRHQLAEALREKETEEPVIEQVLDRLTEVGLIDDAAFARTWVRTRHELKGLGRAALRHELRDRGVDDAYIAEALEQIEPEDEDAAAREMVEKKLRGVVVPAGSGADERREREKHTRRLVAMLGRRGHAPSTAFRIVQEVLDEHSA
ncbi:RecX family transcriptional regulator [Nesterenkonia sp. F]|uniref:regulatory protein RecX n=1 Tax=Nesterenkonia sp. F TaxID=795955 RepID=UPI000255CA18